jgi:predicted TIM-barrel fold metal-dependent hydrolase
MVDVDAILRPWWQRLLADCGPLELFDAHTHIGANDPDGFRQEPEQLLQALRVADARAVVFAMHEPDGYARANDRVLEVAARSDARLIAFCRVDPHTNALAEARRCLDAGASGIKLHPRAERFTLSVPAVRDLVALAHERRVPVLIHAGRGIPALGRDTVRLSGEFTDARLILAHAAISDLAWLWRVLPEHPNLFIDTAWWNPSDLVALFALAPPAHLLWASDSPYGLPLAAAIMHVRCALQAGVDPAALPSIAGAQLQRLLDGGEPVDAGPAPREAHALDPVHERVVSHLTQALGRIFGRGDPEEAVALSRLACAVGDDDPHARLFSAVLELLDLYEEHLTPPEGGRPIPAAIRFLVMALTVARTPDVPLPDLAAAPAPTQARP